MKRIRRSLVGLVIVGALASGCAASAADIQPMAADALSAARSAELGIRIDEAGRTFATTARVLLDDMAARLGEVIAQLEQTQTADAAAELARTQALAASREAVDAVHRAQQGDEAAAVDALNAAISVLDELAGE
ncbi:hypothetical protein [Microbacterium jejuense]|uniref:hypothetical protein n=1 Tax=Microbacterium jejuense TaxID=1263637 RepID=UPI0031F14F6B